jgi:serine phosphatase RsbU (regulator of sigma subunit)
MVQRGFTVLLSLASMAVTLLFALSLSHYLQPANSLAQPFDIALGAAFGTMLLWGGTQIHRRVSGRIDRAFFRSAYDARMILENLAERSSTATDRQELAHLLENHLAAALQPRSLFIYLRAGDDQLNVAFGKPPEGLQNLPVRLPLLTELTRRGQPLEFASTAQVSESETSPLAALSPECLVPMVGRGERLVGLLVLGARLSEEPYSSEDKRLLSSVATQAATALENMNLAEEIAERIESERRVVHEMEISRRLLEADNARKTKELEEARRLQLSMLPGTLPVLPNLDIAVYMKTATEVGGDYYDFAIGSDGTLTVAIGDATGHGAKAGTMVVAAKSLFNGFSDTPDLLEIFRKLTGSIKRLNMRPMYMSMLLLRVKGKTAVVSSAGMPCPLIYRAATRDVEEVTIKGMPLGAFLNFPYEQRKLELSAGDAIVLMSDGFPEMFNNKQETLGYSRVKEIVGEVGHKQPQEIIDYLSRTGEQWANGRGQDDDVTFVVLKVKQHV